MNKRAGQRGFGLLVLIAAVAVAGLLTAGAAWQLVSQSAQIQLQIDQAKAHYLAQAGIMRAIRNWYNISVNGEIARTMAPINTTVTGNQIFKVGYESDGATVLESNYAYVVPGIALIRNVITAQNLTGSASITTLGITGTVPAGDFIVMYIAADGGATGAQSCSDSAGNTYPIRSNVVNAANSNAVVRTVICGGPVTTALSAGATFTYNWTAPATVAAKAMTVAQFSGVDSYETQAATSGTGTAASSGNETTTKARSLIVGAIGVEGPTGDTFTIGTGWMTNPPTRVSTTSGTAASNVTINPMYRVVSAATTYAASATITNRDWSAAVANFYAANRWFVSGANRRLRGWQVYNRHASSAITLDKVKITWSPAGAELLNDFVVNGTSVWPGGTAASGSTVDVTNTALAAGSAWSGDTTYIQWNGAVNAGNPVTVTIQLIFSGDTATTNDRTQDIVLWNGNQAIGTGTDPGMPSDRSWTITSTGQVNQTAGENNFKVLRTIKARVSGGPETAAAPSVPQVEITDWDVEDKNIP